jgi:arginase
MSVALLGFNWDASSSYARGPAMGPRTIEALLFSEASSPYSLSGVNIAPLITARDFPDISAQLETYRDSITATTAKHIAANRTPLSLGGDHSITFPILQAIKAAHGPVNVLHIDAHMDMHEDLNGDPYSHASPFARALDEGCIAQLVQVGIRSTSPAQLKRAKDFKVISLGAEAIHEIPAAFFAMPLYLTIDLDGLDPAFAPGVSHPEPGGLTSREVIQLIGRITGKILGADIVELNPERDQALQTAGVAVRLIKEIIAKIIS